MNERYRGLKRLATRAGLAAILLGTLTISDLAMAQGSTEGTTPPPGKPKVTCDTKETPIPWNGPFEAKPHYGYSPIMAATEVAWANKELGMTAQVYGCDAEGNLVFVGPVQSISTPNGEPITIGLQMPKTGANGEPIAKHLNVYELVEYAGFERQYVDEVTADDMDLTNQVSLPQAQK